MRVKVKIEDVLARTERATLYLISGKEVWLPSKAVGRCQGNYINLNKGLAVEKQLRFKEYYHVPKKIKPKKHEAIDELRFNPK